MHYREDNCYRLKASYQKHMSLGMLAAVVVVGAPALFLSLSAPAHHGVTMKVGHGLTGNSSHGQAERSTARRRTHGLSGAGFVVVPDNATPTLAARPTENLMALVPSPDIGNAAVSGPGTGAEPFEEVASLPAVEQPAGSITPSSLTDRDTIVMTVEVHPQYPPVAIEAGKEGKVSLLVYADKTGRFGPFPDRRGAGIKTYKELDYCVISEEPRDWFFASNVVKVLPKWRFLPKVKRGAPMGDFLVINYYYCASLSCSRLELQYKNAAATYSLW